METSFVSESSTEPRLWIFRIV